MLSLHNLSQYYDKIVYLDIDIHHGDGVQNAFYNNPNVLTISFHRYIPGVFFPATLNGGVEYKGDDIGIGYNLNIPLPAKCTDDTFIELYEYTLECIQNVYKPQALVVCIGADGLSNDPLVSNIDVGWKLTPHGIQHVVQLTAKSCVSSNQKLLLLGGGGYNPTKTALTYFLCTNAVCEIMQPGFMNMMLPHDLPHELVSIYGSGIILSNNNKEEQPEEVLSKKNNMCLSWKEEEEYNTAIKNAKSAIALAKSFIQCKEYDNKKRSYVSFFGNDTTSNNENGMNMTKEDDWEKDCFMISKNKKNGKRFKKKKAAM